MSIKTYGQYKSTSTSWANRIPSHWEMLPAKRAFERKKELNSGMRVDNRLALTMKGVVRRSLDDVEGLQASEFETYQIFQEGNLAFKLIDLQNVKTSRVGLVPEEGIMSPAYIRLEGNGRVIPKYAYWYFMKLYHECIFNELGGGVRQTIGHEELLSIPLLYPPHSEQTAIASFLDRETAKIDALIAEQQRLIELLQEKRQAVISHAVTKGLNPDAPMKDSGVKWLGEVPEHWEVAAIKWTARINSGKALDPSQVISAEPNDADAVRLIGGNGLIGYTGQSLTKSPSIIIGRVGALCGNVHHELAACWVTDNALILRANPETWHLGYLSLCLKARNLNQLASKTAQPLIVGSDVSSQLVPIPPLEEQVLIESYIQGRLLEFESLLASLSQVNACLKERRSALISAAVTGQIDVRGLVPEAVAQ